MQDKLENETEKEFEERVDKTISNFQKYAMGWKTLRDDSKVYVDVDLIDLYDNYEDETRFKPQ
jgi:hypothetical protein